MSRTGVGFAALAALSALTLTPALAAETSDGWEVVIAPYAFGASMDGTAAVRGVQADIDLSTSELKDHLEMGFMGLAVARKGDWGVIADGLYVELGGTTQMPPADVDPTLGILTVQGLRRLSGWADLTFGARWNHLNGEVAFKAPIHVTVDKSEDWVDPVVGIVLRTSAERRWHATLIADAGGFGVGSDLSWEVMPSIGFDLTKSVSLEVGYKYLDTDYEDGEGAERFQYDVALKGPVAGVAFRF